MNDLTGFLLARIAEDEAAADLVLRPYGHDAATNDAAWWSDEREWFRIGLCSDDTPLLTRMTPQRVLAECEAKRRIVELHGPRRVEYGSDVLGCETCDDLMPETWRVDCLAPGEMLYPCETLQILALPYADHPDYRDDWRPS